MPLFPDTPTFFPPNGFDRATGIGPFPGTPAEDSILIVTPSGATLAAGATFFEEFADSPTIERAEQATITHRFACDEQTGIAIIGAYSRGLVLMDSFGDLTRVLSATATWAKGGYMIITIVSEGLTFDSPPDLFSIEIVELNPGAEKHPRYTELTYADRVNVRNSVNLDATDVQQQMANVIQTLPGAPAGGIGPINTTARTRYNEAKELLLKLYKGEESFYLPGYKISWSQYFWSPQFLDPGGYIENPITAGGLPYFFWSIDGSPVVSDNNWFSALSNINPVMYGNDISWLRQADSVEYERTWFKVTHSWIGGPLGHWDNEWYNISATQAGQNRVDQPYQTNLDAAAVVL